MMMRPADDDRHILLERLRVVALQAPITLGVTVFIALATAIICAHQASAPWLTAWFCAAIVLAALRWIAARHFLRAAAPDAETWNTVTLGGSAVSGALWGAIVLLMWAAPMDLRLLLATIVGGMCAGTTAVNSAYGPAVFAFVAPAMVPLAIAFAARGTLQDLLVAGMVCAFPLALSGAALRAHRMFGEHIRLELTSARQQRELHDAQSRLKEELHERLLAEERLQQGQKLQAIGRLAGGIAHDFNNVLQAVASGAALIERQPENAAQTRRIARMISDASARGSSVTRRLLTFSRRGELLSERIDAAALLAGMRDILSHTLGAGISVLVETASGLPPLRANKEQLETVLLNLASNARDAMGGTGVLTLCAATHTASGESELAPGRYIRLSVRDTGKGMMPDVLLRATEPFFTTKAKGEGTGLGLAMARAFCEQSSGALLIESAPGAGTTVSLLFPEAERGATETEPPPPVSTSIAAGRHRLLIVDDEDMVRTILAEELAAEGFAVHALAEPQAALAFLESGAPVDLVISDLSMPGMDGVTFIAAARRRSPNLPAIILTGFANDETVLADSALGAPPVALLRKPVRMAVLKERISSLLCALELRG